MSQEPLRVEFRVELENRRPAPKPEPRARAERKRVDRAARRARNLALAYWIDHMIRSGAVDDLAAVARMCGVSRAIVSRVMAHLGMPALHQASVVAHSILEDDDERV